MRKRFIVLIDFSAYSPTLLKYAYDWGQQADAELLLVHQTNAITPALADSESRETIIQQANAVATQQMKDLCRAILPAAANYTYIVSETPLHRSLQRLLSEPVESLIFVGVKGTGLIKKILLGSVAVEVIENTDNVVVAIPQEVTRFSPEKLFVAVSREKPLDILAFNNFLHFLGNGIGEITFFYLAKPSEKKDGIEQYLVDLAKLFGERFNTQFAIYEGRDAFSEIKKVINNKIEEILIVQKGSRLLSDQMFRKFLVNELVYEGQTPLVVLP